MAKFMSKSELIQKIAEQHSNNMTRKDVKGVIESLAPIGYMELKRIRGLRCAGFAKLLLSRSPPRRSGRHQSVRKGANNIQGEAGSEDHQGSASKGCQRRSIVASKTSMALRPILLKRRPMTERDKLSS